MCILCHNFWKVQHTKSLRLERLSFIADCARTSVKSIDCVTACFNIIVLIELFAMVNSHLSCDSQMISHFCHESVITFDPCTSLFLSGKETVSYLPFLMEFYILSNSNLKCRPFVTPLFATSSDHLTLSHTSHDPACQYGLILCIYCT